MAKCGWLRSWQICEESQRRRLQRDIVSQHKFGCRCKGKDLRNAWLLHEGMERVISMASRLPPIAHEHVKRVGQSMGASVHLQRGLLGRSGLFSWPLISVANDDATTATASCRVLGALRATSMCFGTSCLWWYYATTLCTSRCPVCSLFVPMFLFFWKVAIAPSSKISSHGIGFLIFCWDVGFSQALFSQIYLTNCASCVWQRSRYIKI